jgi:metal-responsive CopG/Arc/MetJ family transcriptional regulator
MRTATLSIRLTQDIADRVNKATKEDYRKRVDEINYLLELGLKARESLKTVERNHTQIDMAAFK